MKITQGFRADIIVENRFIIEVKALPWSNRHSATTAQRHGEKDINDTTS
jgi:hypothetical protein